MKKKKNDKGKKQKENIIEEDPLSKTNNQLTVVSTTGYNMVSTTLPNNFFEGLLILEMELNDEFTMEKLLSLVNQYSLAIEFYLDTDPMKAKAYQNRMEYLLTNKDTLVQLQRQKLRKNNENNNENEKKDKIIRRSTQFNKTKAYVKLKQEDIKSEDISKKVNKVLDTGNLKDDEKKNVINLIEDDIKRQDESWKSKYKSKKKNKLRNSSKINIGGALLLKKKFFGDKKSDLSLKSSYSGDLNKKNKQINEMSADNLYEIKEDNNIIEEEKEDQNNEQNEIVEHKENNEINGEKKEEGKGEKAQEEKKDGEDNKNENNKDDNKEESKEKKDEDDKNEINKDINLDDLKEVDEEKIEEKKEDENKIEENKEEENKIVEEKKEEENKIEEKKEEEKKEEEKKEEEKKEEEKKEEENKIVDKKKEDESVINTNEKNEDNKEINILESFDPNSLPSTINRTSILDEDMIRKIKPDDEIAQSIEDQIKYLQNLVTNLVKEDDHNKNDNDNDNDNDNEEGEENEDNKGSEKDNLNLNKIIENKENKDDKQELMDSKINKIPAKFQSTYYQVESLINEYMNDFNEFYYKEIFEQFSSQLRELYELKYKKYIEIRNEYHTQIKENEYLLDNDENLNEEKKAEIQQTIDSLNEEQQHQIAIIEDEFNRKIIDKITEFKLNSFKKNSGIQLMEEQVKLDIYSLINDSFY